MLEAEIYLRRLLWQATVYITFLNMLKPIYMHELPEGTIQEGFKCPIYNYNRWIGYKFEMNCVNGLVFHCAKEYNTKKFIKACAEEKKCSLGKEPLLVYKGNDLFEVVCKECYDFNQFYNPHASKLSSTMSRCPELKLDCSKEGVIECPITDPQEKYYADRKCRCDSRNNFVPDCFPDLCHDISSFYCTSTPWKGTSCFPYNPCPRGEERLIKNFTCVKSCGEGNFRPDDSDECIPNRNYTASSSTPSSVLSALISGSTSASTSSTSSLTTIKSSSPSSFNTTTSLSRSVSTTDTGNTTDRGMLYRWVYAVIFVAGCVVALIICGIIYFVKTRVIPALERTYTDFDCLRSIRTADKTKRDSTHIDSGPDDSLPTTENDDFVSVNHIADIQNLSDDTKIELARYVLRKCYESIITYMDANTVCIRLFQNGFLTFGQKQFIDGYQFKRDKNIYIYDRLYANSSAGNYDMFKDILLETKDTELIKNLEQEEYTFLSTLLGQQQIHDPSPTTTTVIANIHQLNETAPGQQQRHDSSPRTSTTQADIQQLNQIEPGQQHRHDPSPTTNTAIADIHQLNETEPGRQQIYDPSSRTTTALADIRQLSETEPGVEDPLLGQTDESAV